MVFRECIVACFISAVCVGSTMALAPTALAATSSVAVTPATTYSCHITVNNGVMGAGYYSGNTVSPSTTEVTAAGKEAQCLLQAHGYSVGTVDGEFGSHSQAAMKGFQTHVNEVEGYKELAVDGIPGPESWPWLRTDWI